MTLTTQPQMVRFVVMEKKCSFEGCENKTHAKGLCQAHRQQQRKNKELKPLRPKVEQKEIDGILYQKCNYKDCENPWQTIENFSMRRSWRAGYCKKCCAKIKYLRDSQDPRISLLTNAKYRAKKHNLEFDLILEDIIIPEFCPLLEIPIFKGTEACCPNSPTVDRVDSNKGYTKDNIQIISFKANTVKNNATKEEITLLLKNWK